MAAEAGQLQGIASWHAMNETWSVLTRLPVKPRITPTAAWADGEGLVARDLLVDLLSAYTARHLERAGFRPDLSSSFRGQGFTPAGARGKRCTPPSSYAFRGCSGRTSPYTNRSSTSIGLINGAGAIRS